LGAGARGCVGEGAGGLHPHRNKRFLTLTALPCQCHSVALRGIANADRVALNETENLRVSHTTFIGGY
jgi:hypothetical protein